MEPYGPWEPLTPAAIGELLGRVGVPWWIAGGWALDLFLGYESRPHDDTDVLVLRPDQLTVQRALAGWDLHAADPPKTLRPWLSGEELPVGVHDVWCRPSPSAPWALQLMLAETEGDEWVYRRDRRVRRPVAALGCVSPDGLPYLAPEVQLLYKAAPTPRAKDSADFAAVAPRLPADRRDWLRDALAVCAPTAHGWPGSTGSVTRPAARHSRADRSRSGPRAPTRPASCARSRSPPRPTGPTRTIS